MRYGFIDFLWLGAGLILWKFLFSMLSLHQHDSPIGQAASLAV